MRDHDEVQMIDCEEAERRLHRYLDRELSEAQVAEVRHHLEVCDNCRARFRFEEGLRRLIQAAGRDGKAPESLRERVRRLSRP